MGLVVAGSVGAALLPAASATASPQAVVTHKTIYTDGVTGITDPSYNSIFSGDDAATGVLALIEAGSVRINDTQVPTPTGTNTYSTDRLEINGGNGLWENSDGTWSWTAHITYHGENETYAVAAEALVNAVSIQRGLKYQLTLVNGVVTKIDESVYDAAFANTVTRGSNYTTIKTLGLGDGSTDKPNPSSIKFPNANVTSNPQAQTMVKYWDDAKGWHLQRAASKRVVVDVDGSIPGMIPATIDGAAILDSRISLQYSEPWNRPSQPIEAMLWLGVAHETVTQWFGVPGITIGFSYGPTAKPALKAAIKLAQHALDTVAVSAAGDGSDIPQGQMWVTEDYHNIFHGAIADARTALANKHLTNDQYQGALYELAQAYGAPGGQYSSQDNTYFGGAYNGVGFWTFAQAHLGTEPTSSAKK